VRVQVVDGGVDGCDILAKLPAFGRVFAPNAMITYNHLKAEDMSQLQNGWFCWQRRGIFDSDVDIKGLCF
jgi:hypothetical protein